MRNAVEKVKAFHDANGLSNYVPFNLGDAKEKNAAAEEAIGSLDDVREGLDAVKDLAEMLERCYNLTKDVRFLRMHLIIEEAAETCISVLDGDPVETADGLCDLAYVTIGTAIALNLPIEECFDEVHASNMTKRRVHSEENARFRGKGPNYRPPNLQPIIEAFRQNGGHYAERQHNVA